MPSSKVPFLILQGAYWPGVARDQQSNARSCGDLFLFATMVSLLLAAAFVVVSSPDAASLPKSINHSKTAFLPIRWRGMFMREFQSVS